MRSLMWFRADLRVEDNPALHGAGSESSRGMIGVFTICPMQWREHDWAAVKVAFLLSTLEALKRALHKLRIPLLIVTEDRFESVPEALLALARKHECDALFFNREYEVNERRRDDAVEKLFKDAGLEIRAFHDQTVLPPGSLQTSSGGFYTVFSPFRRKWIDRVNELVRVPTVGMPRRQSSLIAKSSDVPDRVAGFDAVKLDADLWPPGEAAARRRLAAFMQNALNDYRDQRDRPATDGTSRLSPYLMLGAVSIRQCLVAVREVNGGTLNGSKNSAATWISELVWREFYRHILVGFPRVSMHQPFRLETRKLRWSDDDEGFAAWTDGRTGVPIIDAAMHQLNTIGWMHNRLRMIVAMYLTKDLLIDWRRGERYFMQQLIDGDLASNNGGWQWSASTGNDAAPYFRIFNPIRQSERFDPDGAFIRRWLPALRKVEGRAIHDPRRLPVDERTRLDYPEPIVDHAAARDRALKEYGKVLRS